MSKDSLRPEAKSALGYYLTPILVPERLTFYIAKDFFDRGDLIFITKAGAIMHPDDYASESRRVFSYDNENWYKYVVPKKLVQKHQPRLHEVWDLIVDHARRQPGLNPGMQKRIRADTYVDFYRFVPPEIQEIDAVSPAGKKRYELRQHNGGGYYLNWYARKPEKLKRG